MSDTRDAESTVERRDRSVGPARSREETFFLGGLIAVTLAAAIWFLYLNTIPAMGISFMFGIVTATLAYAFLGARGDDTLTIKGLRFSGAAAVVAGVVIFANGALDNQLGLARRNGELTQLVRDAQARAAVAEEQATRTIVLDHDHPAHIVGGALVRLIDINTLNGLHEGRPFVPDAGGFHVPNGDHAVNRNRPGAQRIFAAIFRRLDIDRPVAEVLNMSQQEWDAFQTGLPNLKRDRLPLIPFATLATRTSDGHVQEAIVFKNEEVPVVNGRHQTEAYLCVRRILDTRTGSEEPEVVVLTQSVGHCL